jgi:hypothetical protein
VSEAMYAYPTGIEIGNDDNVLKNGTSAETTDAFGADEPSFVEEVVAGINAIYKKADVAFMAIGLYLLEMVFKGDVKGAVSTNPHKAATLKKIAENSKLDAGPKAIGNWIRAAAISKDMKGHGAEFPGLTVAHFLVLGGVSDLATRIVWAKTTAEEGLSARELKARISSSTKRSKEELDQLTKDPRRVIKKVQELSHLDGLGDLGATKDVIRQAYPFAAAVKLLPDVNASRSLSLNASHSPWVRV